MKYEKCSECGLTYDRHARRGCPHCREFAWYYFWIGIGVLGALACGLALFVHL